MSADSPALFFQTELTSWNTTLSVKSLNKSQYPLIEDNQCNFLIKKFFSNNLLKKFSNKKSCKYPWKIEISPDGLYVVILKNNNLELRSSKLDFSHINFHCQVYRDIFPEWRCVGWSTFSNYFGVIFSNGMCNIWDLQGSRLVVKYSKSNSNDPVIKLFIVNLTKIKIKAIILTMKGNLSVFLIQNLKLLTSYESEINFLSTPILCSEISNNLMVLGTYNQSNRNKAIKNGLIMCRMIDDAPFLVSTNSSNEMTCSSTKSWFSNLFIKQSNDAIFSIQLSKDNNKLAAIHLSGTLSIWMFPSLNFQLQWNPTASFINQNLDSDFQTHNIISSSSFDSSLIDMCWWNDEYVVLGLQNGVILILNSDLTENGKISLFPCPQIQSSIDKSFFLLNCDMKLPQNNLNMTEAVTIGNYRFYWLFKPISNFIGYLRDNSVGSFTKDLEMCSLNFQLSQFKLTTPQELFVIHIEKKQYQDALVLAKQYDLDFDIVFQKQWRDSEKSIDDIRNILMKIRKRNWILNECLERIPGQVESLKCLLNFGLKLTESIPDQHDDDFELLIGRIDIGKVIDKPFFHRQKQLINQNGERHTEIRKTDLSASQIELIRIRAKLLNYCDKLLIYEDIIDRSRCVFQPQRFEEFKARNSFELAISFANSGDIVGLESVLTFYHRVLSSHFLVILSNIPECIDPKLYQHLFDNLLRFCQSGNETADHHQSDDIFHDWCESQQFAEICYGIGSASLNNESEIANYPHHNHCNRSVFVFDVTNCDTSIRIGIVSDWFNLRIREIESVTSNVEHAWNLVTIAQNLNVPLDRDLEFNMRFLYEAVYNVQINNSFFSLSDFQSMSNVEKAKLLMSKTDPDRYIFHFIRWIIPFAQEIHYRFPSSIDSKQFFQQYLSNTATRSLICIRKIIEDKECISSILKILDFNDLIDIYLEILYQDDSDDCNGSLNDCASICRMLNGLISSTTTTLSSSNSGDHYFISEQKKLKEIDNYIVVLRMMEKYGVRKTIKFIHENKFNGDIVENFLTTMLYRYLKTGVKSLTKPLIRSVFQEMQMAISTVFTSIHPKLIYKNLLKSLLESGDKKKILLAAEFMDLTSKISIINEMDVDDKLLDFYETTDCIAKAARNYIDSSTSTKDKNFQLGKFCLNLVQDHHESIENELDLVKCCEFVDKYHNSNQSLVPIEVRAVSNRLDLLKICLDNNTGLYRNLEEIVEASHFLCSDKSATNQKFREGEALRLVANKALFYKDWEIIDIVMTSLLHRNHKPCWMECLKIIKTVDYEEIDKKFQLAKYVLTHCPASSLQESMKLIRDLEIASLNLCGNGLTNQQTFEPNTNVNSNLIKQPIKFLSSGLTDISSKLSIKSLIDKSSGTLMKLSQQVVQLGLNQGGENGHELYSKHSNIDNIDKMVFNLIYQSDRSAEPREWIEKDNNVQSAETTLVKMLTLSSLLPVPVTQENHQDEINSIHLKLIKLNLCKDTFLSIIHSLFIDDLALIHDLRHEMKPNLFNRALILSMIQFNVMVRYSDCGIPWMKGVDSPSLSPQRLSYQYILSEVKAKKLSPKQLSILESIEKEFHEYLLLDKVSNMLPGICSMKFFSSVDYRQEIVRRLSQSVEVDESLRYSLILCDRFGINRQLAIWNYFQSFVQQTCNLDPSEFKNQISRFQSIFLHNYCLGNDREQFGKDIESYILQTRKINQFRIVLQILDRENEDFVLFDRSVHRHLEWLHVFDSVFKRVSTCCGYIDFLLRTQPHRQSIIDSLKQVINTENLELCCQLMTEFQLVKEFIDIKKDFSVVLANQTLWSTNRSTTFQSLANNNDEYHDFKNRFLHSLKNFSIIDFENFTDFIYSVMFEKSDNDDNYIDLPTKIDALQTATRFIDDEMCKDDDGDFNHKWIAVNMEIEIWLSHLQSSVSKVVDQLRSLGSVSTLKIDIVKIAEYLPPENYWNRIMEEMLLAGVSYQDFFTFTWDLNIESIFVEEALVSHICHMGFSKFIDQHESIERISSIFEELDEYIDSSSIENIISSILIGPAIDIPLNVVHWLLNEFVWRLRNSKPVKTCNIDLKIHIFSIIEQWKVPINKKLEITNSNNLFIIDSLVQDCDSVDRMAAIGRIIELIELVHEDDHLWQYWVKSCVIKGSKFTPLTFDQFQILKTNKLYSIRFPKLIKDAVQSLVAFNPHDAISLLILKDPVKSSEEIQTILTDLKSNPADYSNTMKNINGKSLELIIRNRLVPLYAKTILFQRLVNFVTKELDDVDLVQDILEQLRHNGLHDEAKWLASSSSHINPALKTIEMVSGFWKRFSTAGTTNTVASSSTGSSNVS